METLKKKNVLESFYWMLWLFLNHSPPISLREIKMVSKKVKVFLIFLLMVKAVLYFGCPTRNSNMTKICTNLRHALVSLKYPVE